jgi:tRNA-2-methylthio-N6-dimethylallyladenosine synthase
VARTYFLRTFGCQMNEHDSERMAGLLEADGLTAARSVDEADVVVLNTCCIRENADNKLYGNLGQLKAVKAARPGMQIAVAGCLAQKDRALIQERAPHVDVVLGTHNVGAATTTAPSASSRPSGVARSVARSTSSSTRPGPWPRPAPSRSPSSARTSTPTGAT